MVEPLPNSAVPTVSSYGQAASPVRARRASARCPAGGALSSMEAATPLPTHQSGSPATSSGTVPAASAAPTCARHWSSP